MIALCVIVKGTDDESLLLKRCLQSVYEHVDGIFIQLNAPKGQKISPKVRKVAEKYTKNIEEYEWTGNFAEARNKNFAQVPKEYNWILWADTDDTFEHPEKIKEVASITPREIQGVYICYDYAHDKFGNVTVSHWNCRLVRNNGSFKWKSSFEDTDFAVHETLSAIRTVGQASNDEFKIIHHSDNARRDRSLIRNVTLLEKMLENQRAKDKTDPRVLYYLATHYYDLQRYGEVINLLTEYLKISGWAEERSQAHVFIGKILKIQGKETMARNAFLMALGENPKSNDALLELGILEVESKRYNEALSWLERTDTKKKIGAVAQFHRDYELFMLIAECLTEIGGKRLTGALKWANKGLKLRPLDPQAVEQRDRIENLVGYQKDMKATARLVRSLRKNEVDKILPFLDNLPSDLQDSPVVIGVRHKFRPVKRWPKKSIAIYCGQGPLGIWGPWSLKEGIGGSEEAVIQLSRELSKLGWKVTVYATPGERGGLHEGVDWKQYWEINPADEFDVLVSWRNPGFFEAGWKARRRYVWMHDVMPQEEFSPERLKDITKVILLSKYHRTLFPNIPDDKILLSANGIIPEDFQRVESEQKANRDPHRIIYMSSHVRGLELLYSIWGDVKKAVPEATLDIYYGWESFVNILKDNPDRMAWRERMIKREKELDGVTDHGKVSHEKIVEEIFKSGIWAYPCPFPEIYCITAVKAQAGGAVPVSSNFAALDETVQFGTKIPMRATDEDASIGQWAKKDIETFKKALIDMLKNPKKQEQIRPGMMKWARKQSWKKVAETWQSEFLS